MQTAQFIEALQGDLRELAQLGGEELVQAAHRLEGAVKQSATLRLIDALTQVALEVSSQLPNGHVDVRLAGQDPELVYGEEESAEPQAQAAGREVGEMRHESCRTPGALTLGLRVPSGEISLESVDGEETTVELDATSSNEEVQALVDGARIEVRQRGDGHEVIVDVPRK